MLTPEIMLRAYASGLFPMARSADDPELMWFEYDPRGIIPLDEFHIPARLKRTMRKAPYVMRTDSDFAQVIDRCAHRPRGETSWINSQIIETFTSLHQMGFAHSVEAWEGSDMVGGLYGVAFGSVFFGESMFSTKPDASKIALVHLVARLIKNRFMLLDVQEANDHTKQFGVVEIDRATYHRRLAAALKFQANFITTLSEADLVAPLLARQTQNSG